MEYNESKMLDFFITLMVDADQEIPNLESVTDAFEKAAAAQPPLSSQPTTVVVFLYLVGRKGTSTGQDGSHFLTCVGTHGKENESGWIEQRDDIDHGGGSLREATGSRKAVLRRFQYEVYGATVIWRHCARRCRFLFSSSSSHALLCFLLYYDSSARRRCESSWLVWMPLVKPPFFTS